ncbi:MAG: UDP-N-acetylglucosamine 2-epimerase [Methanomassiliicoccales archaeon PtaU1.Bin124]|nr:MAG: UDP-N-acetylglucosamine 2-epimerase [Methanomassiliicoccales archaeon PtaU1.Bin124]
MDQIFFDELDISKPKYNIGIGSGSHGQQTGQMLIKIEEILMKERPRMVIIQGDTNTTLAGALAASKMQIPIAHIESGMRSFNRSMPEEMNRVVVDHISQLLFVTSEQPKENLLKEGLEEKSIVICGNTQSEAVKRFIDIAKRKSRIITDLGLECGHYILVTVHRQENTEKPEILKNILTGLARISNETGYPIIFPAHPRTINTIKENGIEIPQAIRIIEPLGYIDFLRLQMESGLIMTDSGGVQEEAFMLCVPCVTLRNETEWVDTIEAGANVLAGTEVENIVACAKKMISSKRDWQLPIAQASPSDIIVSTVMKMLSE